MAVLVLTYDNLAGKFFSQLLGADQLAADAVVSGVLGSGVIAPIHFTPFTSGQVILGQGAGLTPIYGFAPVEIADGSVTSGKILSGTQFAGIIGGGRFDLPRLPADTSGLVLTGQGPTTDPAYAAAAGGGLTLTVEETQVFTGTPPTAYTDLDLSAVIGSNKAFVVLKAYNPDSLARDYYFRANGDTEVGNPVESPYTCRLNPSSFGIVLCHTDASGILEWKISSAIAGHTLDVVAYIK